jgi:hypothetical protein
MQPHVRFLPLIAQFARRTTVRGVLGGGALGLVYGSLVGVGILIASFVEHFPPVSARVLPQYIGALTLTAFTVIPFGGIIGLLAGVVLGAITGCGSGLMIGLLTYLFFTPLAHPQRYSWIIQILGMSVSIGMASYGLGLVLPSSSNPRLSMLSLLIFWLPLGIISLYAWSQWRWLIGWYIQWARTTPSRPELS